MPRVPQYNQQVNITTPNVPAPVATPAPPEEAFGSGVARAQQVLGNAVENLGTVLSKHVVEMERRESQKINLENQSAFQDELTNLLDNKETDENEIPKGYLNRKLNQANGASIQFNKQADEIYKRYKALPASPETRNQMDETLRSTLGVAREKIIRHEASQRSAAEEVATKTFLEKSKRMATLATDPKDLSNLIESTNKNYVEMLKRKGYDDDSISEGMAAVAGEMTEQSVNTYLQTDPMKAKEMLETMQAKHGPLTNYPQMAKLVEGKVIDEQQNALWNKISVDPSFRRSDGTINTTATEKLIQRLNVPAEKKQMFSTYINSKAAVADANRKEDIAANDRSYVNDLVNMHAQGASFEEALASATRYGRDPNDIADKQEQAKNLYTGKDTAFDAWIKSMPQEYQAAGEYAEQVFKSVYPKTSSFIKVKGSAEGKLPAYQAALQEFKLQAMGKSPSQMRQLANDMTKDVVVKPGRFWDTEEIGWKVSAENRIALSQAEARLENDYGVDRVARAKGRLRKEGIDVNPLNIKKLLDKTTAQGN